MRGTVRYTRGPGAIERASMRRRSTYTSATIAKILLFRSVGAKGKKMKYAMGYWGIKNTQKISTILDICTACRYS